MQTTETSHSKRVICADADVLALGKSVHEFEFKFCHLPKSTLHTNAMVPTFLPRYGVRDFAHFYILYEYLYSVCTDADTLYAIGCIFHAINGEWCVFLNACSRATWALNSTDDAPHSTSINTFSESMDIEKNVMLEWKMSARFQVTIGYVRKRHGCFNYHGQQFRWHWNILTGRILSFDKIYSWYNIVKNLIEYFHVECWCYSENSTVQSENLWTFYGFRSTYIFPTCIFQREFMRAIRAYKNINVERIDLPGKFHSCQGLYFRCYVTLTHAITCKSVEISMSQKCKNRCRASVSINISLWGNSFC